MSTSPILFFSAFFRCTGSSCMATCETEEIENAKAMLHYTANNAALVFTTLSASCMQLFTFRVTACYAAYYMVTGCSYISWLCWAHRHLHMKIHCYAMLYCNWVGTVIWMLTSKIWLYLSSNSSMVLGHLARCSSRLWRVRLVRVEFLTDKESSSLTRE